MGPSSHLVGPSSHRVGPSSHFADFFSRSFIVERGPHGSNLFNDLGVFLEESGSGSWRSQGQALNVNIVLR